MKKTRKFWRVLTTLALTLALCMSMAVPAFAFGGSSSGFAGGSGTEADPYHIQTVAQLDAVRNNLGASYVLDNDLDLSSVSEFKPIGTYLPDPQNSEFALEATSFHGTFNGNGHKISNVKLKTGLVSALFGTVSGTGYVHDLVMENVQATGLMYVAGFVGMATDRARIENLHLIGDNNKFKGLMQVASVLGGCNIKEVKNCSAKADVTSRGPDSMGMNCGIVIGGGDDTSFDNIKATGGTLDVGGISGQPSFGYGGAVGCARGAEYITNCSAENITIKAKEANQVGGLIGFTGTDSEKAPTRVDNCQVSNVNIQADDTVERVGGLIGASTYLPSQQKTAHNLIITNSSATGTITGGKYVGAIIGWLSSASQLAPSVTAQVTANGIALPLIGTTEAQTPTSTFDSLSSSVSRIMNEMMSAMM